MDLKTPASDIFKVMLRWRTYDPRRNIAVIFGLIWGLPVPIFALLMELSLKGLPMDLSSLPTLFSEDPWQLFFMLHPLLFAVVFGVAGSVYRDKQDQVNSLFNDLRSKVEALDEANRDLQELDKMKDEFLSNVTHELKTPLVTIQGYSEMLSTGRLGDLTDKQRKALDVMQRNQTRLQELILQLLRYGRMEESTVQIFKAPISIRRLFRFLESSFLPVMEQKSINFQVELPDANLHAEGQEDLIEQVMRNLIGNSRKFTDRGGWIRLGLDKSRFPEKVGLVVEDNGCGISEDALPYIFERFRQGDGSIRRKYGGTGLGLAIVKRILESHKTEIEVESNLGEGTRFTVVLPLMAPDQPVKDRHNGRKQD
jgi:signal transduction histidine kinase